VKRDGKRETESGLVERMKQIDKEKRMKDVRNENTPRSAIGS